MKKVPLFLSCKLMKVIFWRLVVIIIVLGLGCCSILLFRAGRSSQQRTLPSWSSPTFIKLYKYIWQFGKIHVRCHFWTNFKENWSPNLQNWKKNIFIKLNFFSNCKKYIFNWVKYKPTKSSAPRWTTSHSWSPTSIILQGSHPPSQIENCNWCIITTKQSSLAKAVKQIQLAGRIFKELLVGQKLYSSKVFYIVHYIQCTHCLLCEVHQRSCWVALLDRRRFEALKLGFSKLDLSYQPSLPPKGHERTKDFLFN